jgi:hypothetical protein
MKRKDCIDTPELLFGFFSELLIIIGAISIGSLFIKTFNGNDGGLLIIGFAFLSVGVIFKLGLKFFT